MTTPVILTPLRRIPTPGGDVRHALKRSDPGFSDFGEAYFSTVDQGTVKGWKRHRRMTLNLVVVVGEIRFVVHDGAGDIFTVNLTPSRPDDYARLTVPPSLWVAFGGVGRGLNMLLNVADIEHDPTESEVQPMNAWTWSWS
ncbi:dTDP-4-dehydrorhamnose 3,5-epimerase [Methylobacterium indicum]|uniref:dTDP-4-dehydrorhamnose 3,5-epimerase n=2 Tax=Methylobacterium indicum TaxID=1775910 RepID=A0ABR5H8H4_9HYPH|nr:dTDP-4-dehydrorhamnose 3,5-epimerase [Methylobacterium indicum]KMO20909.1 dTDP-4-dehydrorhamnose 3,5-epimerase [Methylobacterium indicum]